jgi:hypothetical protein
VSSIRARTHFATDANVLGQVQSVVRIVAVALGAAGIVAVAVRLLAAARARQVIAYRFPSGTLGWRGAGDILVNNARIALAPLAAAYLLDAIRPADGKPWRGWRRVLRSACDTVLGIAVLTNVFVAGASYGAYGLKMVRYTLPYAPVELAALACPLAFYLETRRQTPNRQRLLALCGAGALLLATSALMEGLLPPL